MEQRRVSEEEVRNAQEMTSWAFWFAPVFSTAALVGTVWLTRADDVLLRLVLAVLLGGVASVFWRVRIGQRGALTEDLTGGVVHVLEGAPERAWVTRDGFCYLALQGIKIRIPNDQYQEIRHANSAKVAFLPKSCLAVHVEAIRGLGLNP